MATLTLYWSHFETVTQLSSELNSLANGLGASGGSPYDNSSGFLYADFQLEVRYTSTPPATGTIVAELYILPQIDGTNYATADANRPVHPQAVNLCGVFESRNGATGVFEYLDIIGIPLPHGNFKPYLKNTSGKSLGATGNTLKMKVYTPKTVS